VTVNTIEVALRRRRLPARRCLLALVQGACLLLADGAWAQSSACEQLKATLSARINAAARGFSLEDVPADTPVPPGAKVIGTCEGGARKVLLRRGGAATPSSGDAGAAEPASAPQVAAAPAERTRRTAEAQRERASPAASASASSGPAPRAGARSIAAASAAPTPAPEIETPRAAASASGVEVVRAMDRSGVQPAPVRLDESAVERGSPGPAAFEFVRRHWQWMLAVLLLLMLAWPLWGWLQHRRAYDEAGLPRGPKLN
jgi:hypothetical protein